jgi:5-methylcytosine-specific restriction endonuclease McrA
MRLEGKDYRNLILRVYKRDGYKCRHCSIREVLSPHHIIYRSAGGGDEMNNILTLCIPCHNAEHDENLIITILEVLENDLVVRFSRKNNWKPQ